MKMILFVLAALILKGNSSPVSDCAWGPSYWCQTRDIASMCEKVTYCEKEVWKNTEKKPIAVESNHNQKVDDVECLLCQYLANKAFDYVKENATENDFKKYADDLCTYFGRETNECKTLVNGAIDEIWKEVNNKETNVTEICQFLKLCTNAVDHSVVLVSTQRSIKCEVCNFVSELLVIVTQKIETKVNVKETALKACGSLKPVKFECTNFVNKYFNNLWEKLARKTESSHAVCSNLFDFCPASFKPKRSISFPGECYVCKAVSKHFLKDTPDKIRGLLDDLCKSLNISTDEKSQCSATLEDIFNLLWKDFNLTDSDKICELVGLCSSSSGLVQSAVTLSIVKNIPHKIEPVGDLCDVCKLAANFLKQYVDSNETEETVKEALENVCNVLPDNLQSECTGLVDNYFDTIWKLVKEDVDSGEICQQLKLCTNSTVTSLTQIKPVGDQVCDICKLVATFLGRYVDSNETEETVKEAVENVCSLLPDNLQSECTKLVDNYFDMIWQLVKEDVDSGVICQQLKLCTNSTVTSLTQIKPVGDQVCDICKLVATFLGHYVDSNDTEAEAKAAVEALCNYLPDALQPECSGLVDTYFDRIWQLLEQEFDSGEICEQIGLCNSTNSVKLNLIHQQTQGTVDCLLCTLVVKEAETLFNKSNLENKTVETLLKICDDFPKSLVDECKSLIVNYGEQIITKFIDGADPKLICTAVHLCTSESKLTLVEDDVCTYCVDIFDVIKSLIMSHPSFFEVILEDFCGRMPNTIKGECADLVKMYAPKIVNIIASAINPQTLCKDVKLCALLKKASHQGMSKSLVLAGKAQQKHFLKGIECDGCIQMFEELEILLPKQKDDVVSAISKLCSEYLPEDANAVCQIVCTELGDEIVDDIAYRISPRTDCQAIGVCKTGNYFIYPWKVFRSK